MTGLERLCFGTSTFVAGRLRPDKNSVPGMAALHAAIESGVGLVHSNPKLLTQWAVRKVLDRLGPAPPVRHLIKAEAPLDAPPHVVADKVAEALNTSRTQLGIDQVHVLVLEIDIKRTRQPELLSDGSAAEVFYRFGARVALRSGCVDKVYAYCHRPEHVAGALAVPDIAGVAAQYHRAAPWAGGHLAEITSAQRGFVGMSPLDRGRLLDHDACSSRGRLAALEWVLADPRVSAVAITMSSVEHLDDVIHAVRSAQPSSDDGQPNRRLLERRP